MIADLKGYPEYKDSDHDWLGPLPAHWGLLRAKFLFREVDQRSTTGREELLSVSHLTGVTPRSQKTITMFLAKSNIRHKICRPSDVVINTMWAWMGALGVAQHDGIVSPAYGVYRTLVNCHVLPRYADHLLRTPTYAAEYQRRSTGVNSSRLRLYPEHFLRVPVVIPPPDEQATIVRFLDWTNGRLERAIRAKRKVITLLGEQKQAIIHHAVTRGLDPSVPLKPSGIPWLGDIPQHWGVLRSKYLFREVDNRSATGEEMHLSMSQKLGLIPSSQIEVRRLVSDTYAGAKLCDEGDLVLNRLKAHLGVFALAPECGLVSPDYTVLRPVRELEERFFEAVYRTTACRVELRQRAKGIVQGFWRLYTDDFYDIRVPVPPVDEQTRIMAQLDIDLSGINTAISRVQRELEFLHEYQTRLVADVVTGKLDVREAAARLPDEASTGTADDYVDMSDETEAADEEVAE